MSTTKKRSWECAQCKALFTRSQLLVEHAFISQHKAYRCELCQKAFNARTSFIRHQKSHTKEKKLTCSTCGRLFFRTDHRREHETRHANATAREESALALGPRDPIKSTQAGATPPQCVEIRVDEIGTQNNVETSILQRVALPHMQLTFPRLGVETTFRLQSPQLKNDIKAMYGKHLVESTPDLFDDTTSVNSCAIPGDPNCVTMQSNDPPIHLLDKSRSLDEQVVVPCPNVELYHCSMKGCTQKYYDILELVHHLETRYENGHLMLKAEDFAMSDQFGLKRLFACPFPGCARVGIRGFPRRDKLACHHQVYHGEPLPKGITLGHFVGDRDNFMRDLLRRSAERDEIHRRERSRRVGTAKVTVSAIQV